MSCGGLRKGPPASTVLQATERRDGRGAEVGNSVATQSALRAMMCIYYLIKDASH